MTVLGIICEYNPFHKGHRYHIEKAREITGADTVVAVMSGNFVQRGDVSIFDKMLRAKTAINNGIDLVIELPAVMSLCSAERFALCGVQLLDSLNAVQYISFGAENDDLSVLKRVADILYSEPVSFKEALATELGKGLSYALARCNAVSSVLPEAKNVLASPNNILAIEYLKAILKLNSPIIPIAIKRKGSDYNSYDIGNGFISATGAREIIFSGNDLRGYVPENTLSAYGNGKIHSIKNMEKAIIADICKKTASDIANVPDVSEGLENKIKKSAMECSDFHTLCDLIKSKRYAHSRIRRILLSSYLGITKKDLLPPQYIKILDFNEKGQSLLNKIKQEAKLPLVKNFNQVKEINNPSAEDMWKKELLFDRIYDLF